MNGASSIERTTSRFERALAAWTRGVVRRSTLVVALSVILAAGALLFASARLGIDTDTAEMLSVELPFRQINERYKALFPGNRAGITVVVDATTSALANRAARSLVDRLRGQPRYVQSAALQGARGLLEDYWLLYMDADQLASLSDRLLQAEPLVDAVLADPTVPGVLSGLAGPLQDPGTFEDSIARSAEMVTVLREMGTAVESFLEGDPYEIPWADILIEDDEAARGRRAFVQVVPVLDHTQMLPAGEAISVIRNVAAEVESDGIQWVRVRITGQTALEHEELEGVRRSAVVSGILAVAMVCVVLSIGLGSLWMMMASVLTLAVGLSFTAAFAAAAVGELNMISLAFALLYVGLGVDYAIHLIVRYRELAGGGTGDPEPRRPASEAIVRSVLGVRAPLFLCAATTSLGFFAFLPTAYRGVAELGLIAGTSMFIGLAVTITLLPALLALGPVPAPSASARDGVLRRLIEPLTALPYQNARAVRWSTVGVGLASVLVLTRTSFDPNANNLRDPTSESVSTFEDLLSDPNSVPWSVSVLVQKDQAEQKAARLRHLPTVAAVRTLEDFVPVDQEAKLDIMQELAGVFPTEPSGDLGGAPQDTENPDGARYAAQDPNGTERAAQDVELPMQALRDLRDLSSFAANRAEEPVQSELVLLNRSLRDLLYALEDRPVAERFEMLTDFDRLTVGSLRGTLVEVLSGLDTGPLEPDGFSPALTEQWVAADGTARVQVIPRADLSDPRAMRTFVDDVLAVSPDATDLPVIYVEAGRAVVRAFGQAFTWAFMAISIVLLLVYRSVRSTFLMLFPLCLAAITTGAVIVLFGIPFNFANIIALPLLFGLGVDSGIHIFHRARSSGSAEGPVLETSTARGVLLSGVTTTLSFATLAFTSHPGISSLGVLLAVGVILIQVFTLLVLPAFLEPHRPPGSATPAMPVAAAP